MKLKTSEFLRLSGTTPRTLRYYEDKNAINPHRDSKNDYRYYSEHDLIMLWEARSLNNLGVPIDSIPFRRQQGSVSNIIESLSQIELSLDEQITLLEQRLRTVISTKHRYERIARSSDSISPYSYQGIYRLYVNDPVVTSHPEFDECIRKWVASIPQTKFTMTIDHTQLTGDPDHALSVRMGLGISKRSARNIELITQEPVHFTPRVSGAMCHMTLKNPLEIHERDLAPLMLYAKQHDLEISGDFHARLSHISTDSDYILYHFFMHAVME